MFVIHSVKVFNFSYWFVKKFTNYHSDLHKYILINTNHVG